MEPHNFAGPPPRRRRGPPAPAAEVLHLAGSKPQLRPRAPPPAPTAPSCPSSAPSSSTSPPGPRARPPHRVPDLRPPPPPRAHPPTPWSRWIRSLAQRVRTMRRATSSRRASESPAGEAPRSGGAQARAARWTAWTSSVRCSRRRRMARLAGHRSGRRTGERPLGAAEHERAARRAARAWGMARQQTSSARARGSRRWRAALGAPHGGEALRRGRQSSHAASSRADRRGRARTGRSARQLALGAWLGGGQARRERKAAGVGALRGAAARRAPRSESGRVRRERETAGVGAMRTQRSSSSTGTRSGKQVAKEAGGAGVAAAGRGQKPGSGAAEVESGGDVGGKLVHFDGPLAFTADDLLCATAEIMGKSTYGMVYKATLEDGSLVAVKRLREMPLPALKQNVTEHFLNKISP